MCGRDSLSDDVPAFLALTNNSANYTSLQFNTVFTVVVRYCVRAVKPVNSSAGAAVLYPSVSRTEPKQRTEGMKNYAK